MIYAGVPVVMFPVGELIAMMYAGVLVILVAVMTSLSLNITAPFTGKDDIEDEVVRGNGGGGRDVSSKLCRWVGRRGWRTIRRNGATVR